MLRKAYYYTTITKLKRSSCEVQKNLENLKGHRRQLPEQSGSCRVPKWTSYAIEGHHICLV